jgi:hypothetical protein
MVKINYSLYTERRLTERLLRYWREQSIGKPFPSEHDLEPDELARDWDNCFLVQRRDIEHVEDYNYTYLGRNIVQAYLGRLHAEHNVFMIGPNARMIRASFKRVIITRAPVREEGELVTVSGQRVKYRQVMLPIGTPEGRLEAIFGGLCFHFFDPEPPVNGGDINLP